MIRLIRNYFLYFMLYSFIGWIYEVLVGLLENNMGFVNRGFLFGPYLPVYGLSALFFIMLPGQFVNKKIQVCSLNITPVIVFISVLTLATVLELITSYIMELSIGRWLWDYTDYFMNFEGRIALKSSFRFGLGGTAILYIAQPLFSRLIEKREGKPLNYVSLLLFILFIIDLLLRIKYGSNFKGVA